MAEQEVQTTVSVKIPPKFPVLYLGSMAMDRLYSQTMQPWVMAEIRRKKDAIKDVVIEVIGEVLRVVNINQDGDPVLFEHHLKGLTRFAKLHQDPRCFAYLTRYQLNADFECHVYLVDSEEIIPQLFKAIREASKDIHSKPPETGAAQPPGVAPGSEWDGGDQCKSLFEVKYMGRAKVVSKRLTADYIDGLAEKMIAREEDMIMRRLEEKEVERKKQEEWDEERRRRHASGSSVQSLPDALTNLSSGLTTENKLVEQKKLLQGPSAAKETPAEHITNCSDVALENSSSSENVSSTSPMTAFPFPHTTPKSILGEFASDSDSSKENLNSSGDCTLVPLGTSPQPCLTSPTVRDPLGALSFDGDVFTASPESGLGSALKKSDPSRRRHSSHREEGNSYTHVISDRFRRASGDSQDSVSSLHEPSRVMVLQISHHDLALISLDKKVAILQCMFKDISSVSQGSLKQDMFGIVAREGSTFICYILNCLSGAVVSEIMGTLQTAFAAAYSKQGAGANTANSSMASSSTTGSTTGSTTSTQSGTQNQVCTMCPLHQLHRLSQEIGSMSQQAAHDLLVKKVQLLPDKELNDLNHKMQMEAPESFEESNEVIMIYLRQLCERKQKEHSHISEGNKSNKSEINFLEEKTKLFEGFRSKARKSLTTSFETLLSRGKKKDDPKDGIRQRSWTTDSEASWASKDSSLASTPDISPMTSPMSKEFHHDFPSPPTSPGPLRKRSATIDSVGSSGDIHMARRRDFNHNKTNSPLKTTFLLATNGVQQSDSFSSSTVSSPMDDTTLLASTRRPSSSWRKAIFNRVCTPQHSLEFGEDTSTDSVDGKLHNTLEIRAMWKKAILETLLLIRMEKENHDIRARQEEGGVNCCRKLDYQELTPCLKEITSVWEQMLAIQRDEAEGRGGELVEDGKPVPMNKLLDFVKKGVPRALRGQIWLFLMQQHQMSSTVPEGTCEGADYEDLLKQLTTHQHAILIDLGRTFPCHPYFAKALGPGQLELFNLLKAYSLLDPEVGYCQGLSFIVGLLLMHMEEISAFHVLKYMMYDLGLRKQFRPNMTALQIKLYQLTRLLHDHYKDVYEHFETHEISPTLYAAPWFLTLFASQFPLGFVARVFDMIFVQGIDALFKVALMLIGNHRALILQCDSFESVVDFLKTTLPEMVQVQMERIINQAFELDISKELQAYEVEYHVLSEEMTFSPHHSNRHHHVKTHSPSAGSDRSSRLVERRRSSIDIEMMYRVEHQNRALKNQNIDLLEKLQHAQSQQRSLELSVHSNQIEQEKLKSHIRTLELERGALLQAVAKLRKLIPREALQQLNLALPPMPDWSPSSPALARATFNTTGTQASDTDLGGVLKDSPPPAGTASCTKAVTAAAELPAIHALPHSHLQPTSTKQTVSVSVSKVLNFGSQAPKEANSVVQSTSTSGVTVSSSPRGPDPTPAVAEPALSRASLPMPHLQLSTSATTRSISNSAGNLPSSNPLTPEERRRAVKVVVQQSPTTNCPDRQSSNR